MITTDVYTYCSAVLYRAKVIDSRGPKELGGNRRTADLKWPKGYSIPHQAEGVLRRVGVHLALFHCSGASWPQSGGGEQNRGWCKAFAQTALSNKENAALIYFQMSIYMNMRLFGS